MPGLWGEVGGPGDPITIVFSEPAKQGPILLMLHIQMLHIQMLHLSSVRDVARPYHTRRP